MAFRKLRTPSSGSFFKMPVQGFMKNQSRCASVNDSDGRFFFRAGGKPRAGRLINIQRMQHFDYLLNKASPGAPLRGKFFFGGAAFPGDPASFFASCPLSLRRPPVQALPKTCARLRKAPKAKRAAPAAERDPKEIKKRSKRALKKLKAARR